MTIVFTRDLLHRVLRVSLFNFPVQCYYSTEFCYRPWIILQMPPLQTRPKVYHSPITPILMHSSIYPIPGLNPSPRISTLHITLIPRIRPNELLFNCLEVSTLVDAVWQLLNYASIRAVTFRQPNCGGAGPLL